MRATIELLKKRGVLKVVDTPLDVDLEIPHLAYIEVKKPDSKALLFTNPIREGKRLNMPVLMNLFGSLDRTRLLVGDVEAIAAEIRELMHLAPPSGWMGKLSMATRLFGLKSLFPKQLKEEGECQQRVYLGDMADLYDLPVLTTWEKDGGPFITMGQVYTQSVDGQKKNLGMYRLQLLDSHKLALHWQIHKDSSHFFAEYREKNLKMPVSIAIGGDPLYTWCATAPLPYGVNELMLYGFIKKKPARTVTCKTNPLQVPEDADIVIEGWVDPQQLVDEGPFGDHTGYYTPVERYPFLEVSAITTKLDPVYLATVVGKPPIEDKYMGWATERIFLPLLQTNAPDLVDYHMPENGVFHNLILAQIKTLFPGHAKQVMHAFWGVGQMSFVKHALFVDSGSPALTSYTAIARHIADRLSPDRLLITEGVCDALDHSSPKPCEGGKLGVDCTGESVERVAKPLDDDRLLSKMKQIDPQVQGLKTYLNESANPITVVTIKKRRSIHEFFARLTPLLPNLAVVVCVDAESNDLHNPYMLLWRVVNNIDAKRDLLIEKHVMMLDATNKGSVDGYEREWPEDTDCTELVIDSLREKGLLDGVDSAFMERFQILHSAPAGTARNLPETYIKPPPFSMQFIETAVGIVQIHADKRYVLDIAIVDEMEENQSNAVTENAANQIRALLKGETLDLQKLLALFDLPEGTPRTRMFHALLEVGLGETIDYKTLAEKIGSHPRAVARMLATNPYALLIPCHRVIRADGGLGGYRWGGESKKRQLLELEKKLV